MKSTKSSSSEETNIYILQKENDTLKKELSLRNDQCKISSEMVKEHQILLKELSEYKEKFQKYQKNVNDCKASYELEIQKFKRTTKELNDKWNNEYKDKCIKNMNKNAQLETENNQLQSRITAQNKRIDQLEKELQNEKKSYQENQERTKNEMASLKKKVFELQLENEKLKSSLNENLEDLYSTNLKALKASQLENKKLQNELNEIKAYNEDLKQKLDNLQKNDASRKYSRTTDIDEEFSLKKLETDNRYIQYYNKREKRLLLIEAALEQKNKDDARKLFIIEQIQEKFVEDSIKQQLKSQEDKIKILSDQNKCYDEITKDIEKINEKNKNIKENPLLKKNEELLQENAYLKEQNEKQKEFIFQFRQAALKVFSTYKSGFEQIYILLKGYQKSYKSLIDKTSDIAYRMNVHHPLISFYKNLSRFTLYCQNENQIE